MSGSMVVVSLRRNRLYRKQQTWGRDGAWGAVTVALLLAAMAAGQGVKKHKPAVANSSHAAAPAHAATAHGAAKRSTGKSKSAPSAHGALRGKPGRVTAGRGPVGRTKHGPGKRGFTGLMKEPQPRATGEVMTVPAPAVIDEQNSAGPEIDADTPLHLTTAVRSPFLYGSQLEPFFAALRAMKTLAGTDAGTTVRVMQFGDSHTAADIFTGAMRARMQAQFGNGGLGFQYPGHPFAGYHLPDSSRSQSAGWTVMGPHFTDLGDARLGLGGVRLSTGHAGDSVQLTASCSTMQVLFEREAGGGRLQLTDNAAAATVIDTAGGSGGPAAWAGATADPSPAAQNDKSGVDPAGLLTYPCASAAVTTAGPLPSVHEFGLTTLDAAPVRLFGWTTIQPGVTWEMLGLNGAVAPLMLRWNQTLFTSYLRLANPGLIVLAYGTNEAAEGPSHNDEYIASFRRLVRVLHDTVPGAAVLVLGPYDRATKVGRGRHAAWHTFAGTDRIIADQKTVCRLDGCAFYDQRARMGGTGSMLRWAAAGLGQRDHTHLTGPGYRQIADALYADLSEAYAGWVAKQ